MDETIKEKPQDRCNWNPLAECRHPEWWRTAQEYVDSVKWTMEEGISTVESQFLKVKEGCKMCLMAEIARQLGLLRLGS